MLFAQTVDIKEDVNNYIAQLLRPLRISPSSNESLDDIIEWDQDLIAEIIDSIHSQQRLRDTLYSPVSAPPAATILSSQQQRGAMASDKPAGTGMMSAAKDWFLTSKVLACPILDDDG